MARILIIEDEETVRSSMCQSLSLDGHEIAETASVPEAWASYRDAAPDAVVTDINLVGESGIDLVRRLREDGYDGAVVVVTAFGTVESAVEAMKLGADDYLEKPLHLDQLNLLINKVTDQGKTRRKLRLFERLEQVRAESSDLVGTSGAFQRTVLLAERVAKLPVPKPASDDDAPTILILGETGSGKGVIAEHIHRSDPNFDPDHPAPFVHVNCAALPASLIESELFGHEKGAFTDAKSARTGLFEMANGGTIFLDEIGELPLEMQAKLLLVVEQGKIRRIGASEDRAIGVRMIAATNHDLDQRVEDGTFRADLLYRLNALTIEIPPLRERENDAVEIANSFLDRQSAVRVTLTDAARDTLTLYDWPGNVRELLNILRRALLLGEGHEIDAPDLAIHASHTHQTRTDNTDGHPAEIPTLDDAERELILRAIEACDGNVTLAASVLGINRGKLRYRMDRLGIVMSRKAPILKNGRTP